MADYQQTNVSGSSWMRCAAVVITNPLGSAPTVRMDEEIIAALGGKTFSEAVPGLSFPFDPAEKIALRNPQTGDLIPGASMTGLDVYVALYSLYIQRALLRDAE